MNVEAGELERAEEDEVKTCIISNKSSKEMELKASQVALCISYCKLGSYFANYIHNHPL